MLRRLQWGVFILVLVLAACQPAAPAGPTQTPTNSPEQLATAYYQTLQAPPPTLVATPTAPAPPITLPPPPTATLATPPTAAPSPTAVVTAKPIPKPPVSADGCILLADFVRDASVPDGSIYPPFRHFTKTWVLKNTGTCTWDQHYNLVFQSGEIMSGPNKQALAETTAPGGTVKISVDLKAPAQVGTYYGYWELGDPSGIIFATGVSGAIPFWVEIVVSSAAYTPTPAG